jgi:hypothetical protein
MPRSITRKISMRAGGSPFLVDVKRKTPSVKFRGAGTNSLERTPSPSPFVERLP